MAITVTPTIKNKMKWIGGSKAVVADLQLSSTYATGGFALTAAQFGLTALSDVIFMDSVATRANSTPGAAYVPSWYRSTGYCKLFVSGPTSGITQQLFASVKASKAPANDVAGTAAYSDITGGSSLLGANYAYVATSAVDVAANPLIIAAQPDVPRNVNITIHNINGGTVANNAVNYVIVGVFNGAGQTETITFGAVSHANGKCSYKSGLKPFDTITSITPSASSVAGYEAIVGLGSLLGLTIAPTGTASLVLTNDGTPVTLTATLVVANSTVAPGTIAAAKDVFVKYACSGTTAATTTLAELAAAVNVGTTSTGPTLRCMAIGV